MLSAGSTATSSHDVGNATARLPAGSSATLQLPAALPALHSPGWLLAILTALLIKRVGHSKRWPYPAQLTQSECPWSGQRSVLHCLQLPTAKPYLGSSGGRAGFPGEFLGVMKDGPTGTSLRATPGSSTALGTEGLGRRTRHDPSVSALPNPTTGPRVFSPFSQHKEPSERCGAPTWRGAAARGLLEPF